MDIEPEIARRKIIDSFISCICLQTGFERVEFYALETLAEMFSTFISQLSIQIKLFTELQGRTEPTLHDVASALVELGIEFRSLFKYILMCNQIKERKVAPPQIAQIPQPPALLHTSFKTRQHLSYIHEHFPPFPDPHTYIVTESGISNEKEYQKIREIIAHQKYHIEKGLVKFKIQNQLLKYPSKELSIFQEETKNTIFMLIRNESDKPKVAPYLRALLPYEEVLSLETSDTDEKPIKPNPTDSTNVIDIDQEIKDVLSEA